MFYPYQPLIVLIIVAAGFLLYALFARSKAVTAVSLIVLALCALTAYLLHFAAQMMLPM